jgi:hypothetical protein
MAVPRIGRLLDVAAGILLLAGGALYLHAYFGLETLRGRPLADYAVGMEISRLAEFHALNQLSWAGLGIALAGFGVGVYAALVAKRAARAPA